MNFNLKGNNNNNKTRTPQNEKDQENDVEFNNRVIEDEDNSEVFVKREDGPDFRGVSWTRAAILVVKTMVGLGVLSIPNVFHTLGFFPGILLLFVIWAIMTYGGYIFGQFRRNHRSVHSVADAGQILGGSIGRECFGAGYFLFTTFAAGSAILSISIAFNAVSDHAICTMGFVGVSAIITIIFALVKTLSHVSWLGWCGVISIFVGVMITVIGVGVSDRPAAAPSTGPLDLQVHAFNDPTFEDAFVAIVNIIASFAGTCAFFPVMAEMKEPDDYNKSLFSGMSFVFGFNLLVGVVVYYYCGQYVASPALGSAGDLLKKISYGLSLPGLIVTGVLFTHFSAKYLFVRILRKTRHLQDPTFVHWSTWITVTISCAVFSFIIASAIPFFSSLLGLVGALFGGSLCISLPAWMFFYDRFDILYPFSEETGKRTKASWSPKNTFLVTINSIMFVVGLFCMVAGTYSSAVSIKDQYALGQVGTPFSCADNSNS